MTPREKIDAAVDDLLARGVLYEVATPIHYRLFWALGFNLPPPLFQSFMGLFAFHVPLIGVVFTMLAWFCERRHVWEMMVYAGVVGGLVAGLTVAILYRFHAWRFGVPRWSDYAPPRQG